MKYITILFLTISVLLGCSRFNLFNSNSSFKEIDSFQISNDQFRVFEASSSSVTGDLGLNAVVGGGLKIGTWNFTKLEKEAIKEGEFKLELTVIAEEYSKKLNKRFRTQAELNEILNRDSTKKWKKSLIRARLKYVNKSIKKRLNKGTSHKS